MENRIRLAQLDDIPTLLKLLREVNEIHHHGRSDLFKLGTKYSSQELENMVGDESNPIFVYVKENGEVCGYLFAKSLQNPNDSIKTDIKTFYIDDLCVEVSERGKHIGKSLLDYAKDYAKNHDFYNITLNVWALNENAIAFYEKEGFRVQKIGMEIVLD